MAPEQHRAKLRALSGNEGGLKSLGMFVAAGRFQKEFASHFSPGDFIPHISVLGTAHRRGALTGWAHSPTMRFVDSLGDDSSAAATVAIKEMSRESDAEPWESAIAWSKER